MLIVLFRVTAIDIIMTHSLSVEHRCFFFVFVWPFLDLLISSTFRTDLCFVAGCVVLAVVALDALPSRPLHLSIRCQTEWVCRRPLSQHRHLALTLLYSGKGKRVAWRYEERKAAVPMAILKWAITRRPLSSLLIPASSFSLSTPHRRF